MDESLFWRLIDASRAASGGDPEEQIEDLERRLGSLRPEAIVGFDREFRRLLHRAFDWKLWGAAYVIGGGCSDDGFEYFRGWLISRGRAVYEAALADPETLADVLTDLDGDAQVEGFGYVAVNAWESVTGKDPDDFPASTVKHPSKPTGEPWSEDDVEEQFPKLSERFG